MAYIVAIEHLKETRERYIKAIKEPYYKGKEEIIAEYARINKQARNIVNFLYYLR
jgi:protein-tyrosine-phosphatase